MPDEYILSFTAPEIDERLAKVSDAVLYTDQPLTDDQKAQVKKNIGVLTDEDIANLTNLII